MLKLIIRIRPFAGYILAVTAILIMVVSSIPHIPTLKIHTAKSEIRLDYLIHFCEYGFLSFIAFLAFTGKKFTFSVQKYLIIALGVALFAFIDEYHQKLIPGRTFNPKDLISNVSGIVFAIIFALITFKRISVNQTI